MKKAMKKPVGQPLDNAPQLKQMTAKAPDGKSAKMGVMGKCKK